MAYGKEKLWADHLIDKKKGGEGGLRVPCYLVLVKCKSRQQPSIPFEYQELDHIYREPGKREVSVG